MNILFLKIPDDGNKFSNAGTFLFNMVSTLLTNLIFSEKSLQSY